MLQAQNQTERISIHALREEGDRGDPSPHRQGAEHFYPRPPRGGRLPAAITLAQFIIISIHALREEGDGALFRGSSLKLNFYPRPPRGGRPSPRRRGLPADRISIHALREEGDERASRPRCGCPNFYPRPPRGGRRKPCAQGPAEYHFYPRPPRGGRQRIPRHRGRPWPISIHALREEGDFDAGACNQDQGYFYPRPPRGGRRIVSEDARRQL